MNIKYQEWKDFLFILRIEYILGRLEESKLINRSNNEVIKPEVKSQLKTGEYREPLSKFLKWYAIGKALSTNAYAFEYTIASQLVQDQ
jgi:hypothetical protein